MTFKTILSLTASTIKFFTIILLLTKTNAEANTNKSYSNDAGILSIMYHRFNENKYPSTNIKFHIFKEHIDIVKNNGFEFYNPKNLEKNFHEVKMNKKILITVDDAFESFYEFAWPYLKKNKIPFVLFVSTEPVGSNGYMTWEQIKEVEKEEFAFIGNHSHSHKYLIDYEHDFFENDIKKSIEIFKRQLGYNPKFFSYPFGEYSLRHKKFIQENFLFGFGQNSGVIDKNKDIFELPRFPINEKYGDLERFKFLINLNPLEYKSISLEDMLILSNNNPPELSIEFFKNQKNLQNINCFSNEGGEWNNTNINLDGNMLNIIFKEKFNDRRGRINCSLRDNIGWRWFGLQFSIKN